MGQQELQAAEINSILKEHDGEVRVWQRRPELWRPQIDKFFGNSEAETCKRFGGDWQSERYRREQDRARDTQDLQLYAERYSQERAARGFTGTPEDPDDPDDPENDGYDDWYGWAPEDEDEPDAAIICEWTHDQFGGIVRPDLQLTAFPASLAIDKALRQSLGHTDTDCMDFTLSASSAAGVFGSAALRLRITVLKLRITILRIFSLKLRITALRLRIIQTRRGVG